MCTTIRINAACYSCCKAIINMSQSPLKPALKFFDVQKHFLMRILLFRSSLCIPLVFREVSKEVSHLCIRMCN